MLISVSGCVKKNLSLKVAEPQSVEWGKAGDQPSHVWQNYDWIIVSRDKFEAKIK